MGNLTDKMVLIPERMLKCLDTPGFIKEVKNRVGPNLNMKAAYHEVESDYETYFRQRKFSDYSSFGVIYYRNRKKLKTNTQ